MDFIITVISLTFIVIGFAMIMADQEKRIDELRSMARRLEYRLNKGEFERVITKELYVVKELDKEDDLK